MMSHSNKYVATACIDILHKMYQMAHPSLDFKKLVDDVSRGRKRDKEYYLHHTITEKDYEKAKAWGVKKYKLTKREIHHMSLDFLNYSPKFKKE